MLSTPAVAPHCRKCFYRSTCGSRTECGRRSGRALRVRGRSVSSGHPYPLLTLAARTPAASRPPQPCYVSEARLPLSKRKTTPYKNEVPDFPPTLFAAIKCTKNRRKIHHSVILQRFSCIQFKRRIVLHLIAITSSRLRPSNAPPRAEASA